MDEHRANRDRMVREVLFLKTKMEEAFLTLPIEEENQEKMEMVRSVFNSLADIIIKATYFDMKVATLLFGTYMAIASGDKALDLLIKVQTEGLMKHAIQILTGNQDTAIKEPLINLYDSKDAKEPATLSSLTGRKKK